MFILSMDNGYPQLLIFLSSMYDSFPLLLDLTLSVYFILEFVAKKDCSTSCQMDKTKAL